MTSLQAVAKNDFLFRLLKSTHQKFSVLRFTLLLYSRDSAGPVARVELGKSAAKGPDCYARIQQSDMLVIAPDDAARHLATLLLLAGTSS